MLRESLPWTVCIGSVDNVTENVSMDQIQNFCKFRLCLANPEVSKNSLSNSQKFVSCKICISVAKNVILLLRIIAIIFHRICREGKERDKYI